MTKETTKDLKSILKNLVSILTHIGAILLVLPIIVVLLVIGSIPVFLLITSRGWDETMVTLGLLWSRVCADKEGLESSPIYRFFKLAAYTPKEENKE